MPYSAPAGKGEIVNWFSKRNDIKTIIDVGCGSGTYAILLGNKYKFIGVELWAPYIQQFNLNNLYSQIIVGDIRYLKLPKADCIIFGDVIEHLPKQDALKVLKDAESYKHVVVSIPVFYMQQSPDTQGNPYEAHLSYWPTDELMEIFKDYEVKQVIDNIGIFIK